jgi:hypothetical protein
LTNPEHSSKVDAQQLEALARRLHHDPALIIDLYKRWERFRELSTDYATCEKVLERFRHLGRVDDRRVQDYLELRDQLELELRAFIAEMTRRDK